MLQCDRRLGEIETVILDLTEIAKDGLDHLDEKQQAQLDRRVVDLADEKALQMHDRSQAIASFQKQLAPILAQLDRFDANLGWPPTKAQMTTFRHLVIEAKNAIAAAAKSGVVQVPKAGGGTREFFVDRTFLDEAAKLLGEADAKPGKLRESAARDLRRRFVRKDVSKAKSPLTVSGLYHSTAFHQVTVPDEMDFELCQQLKGLRLGPGRDALLKDWADRLGGTRSPQYRNAVVRLDEAIARAEQLEKDGKVYRAEDWESDAVQNKILHAEFPLDPMMKFGGREPSRAEGQQLVADYKYLMAGNLYVRDFAARWK